MKVFIAGSRAIDALSHDAVTHLSRVLESGDTVCVGDADGVDQEVQEYFSTLDYDNVVIYASGGKARNNVGGWPVQSVDSNGYTGFDFYAAKDRQMAKDCDEGVMVWNGRSRGTLMNMVNLVILNKPCTVYLTSGESPCVLQTLIDLLSCVRAFGSKGSVSLINKFAREYGWDEYE